MMDKINLYRWCRGFFAGNVLLFWIIALRYLPTIEWLTVTQLTLNEKGVIKLFSVLAYLGHLGLLALSPAIFIALCIAVFPKKYFIFFLSIFFAIVSAFFLIADTVTYQLYRFHLQGVIAEFIWNGLGGEILGFSPKEYLISAIVFIGLLVLESSYAYFLWKWIVRGKKQYALFQWLLVFLGLSLYLSYSMIIYSSTLMFNRLLIDIGRALPLYTTVLGALLPMKNGQVLLDHLSENFFVQQKKKNNPLHYPLNVLQCAPMKKPLNWVLIVIDAWRFDMLNQQVTPNLFAFSQNAVVFQKHTSGGNATGPGIFSLFYGLPATYWTSMEVQRRGPVLIDELLKQQYQMGLFLSASLRFPHFDKTVFSAIHSLPHDTVGNAPDKRDKAITENFKKFLRQATQQSKPFFSFLFYDGAHSYCAYEPSITLFAPSAQNCNRLDWSLNENPVPYFNRYKNALFLVDLQIQQVLEALKKAHVLENTVVMVTGDHGEEFNDSGQGYWGHASDFNPYQTRTPLIVFWPGQKAKIVTHQTSHFDIAPTMMQKLLGCRTSSTDFSMGKSLFNPVSPDYLILGSYVSFAIRTKSQVTTVFPAGNVSIKQPNGRLEQEVKLDMVTLRKVFQDIHKFYER